MLRKELRLQSFPHGPMTITSSSDYETFLQDFLETLKDILEKLKEMFPRYYKHNYVSSRLKSLTALYPTSL